MAANCTRRSLRKNCRRCTSAPSSPHSWRTSPCTGAQAAAELEASAGVAADGDVEEEVLCVARGDFATSKKRVAHPALTISMLLALAVVAVCAAAPLFLDSVAWVLESIDGRFLLDG